MKITLKSGVVVEGRGLKVVERNGIVEITEDQLGVVVIHDEADRERLRKLFNTSVNEIGLSTRAGNCLNSANITTVGELVQKSAIDMIQYRNLGHRVLAEMQDKLRQLGLDFGMKIDPALLQ